MAEVPSGFSQVTFTTRNIFNESKDKIRQLAEMVEKHCPVIDSLMRAVEAKAKAKGKVELKRSEDLKESSAFVVAQRKVFLFCPAKILSTVISCPN